MEATLALEFDCTAADIAKACHAHPGYAEALKEAAMIAAFGQPIHS